eukprot:6212662-Pleurochrysis_carterae.AAC.2
MRLRVMTMADGIMIFLECLDTFLCACSSECSSLMIVCSEAGTSRANLPSDLQSKNLSAIAWPPTATVKVPCVIQHRSERRA